MKSGMVAAEAVFDAFKESEDPTGQEVVDYQKRMEKSWVWEELKAVRNFHGGFKVPNVLPSAPHLPPLPAFSHCSMVCSPASCMAVSPP